LILDVEVTVAPVPVPLISVDNDKECEPAVFVLQNETDPSMVENLTWNISDGQTFVDMETVVTADMYSGFYNVQLIVTSPQGCIDSTTFFNYLTAYPKPIVDFRHSPDPVYMFNTVVQLTNYTVNGDTYQWFIQDGNPSYSELKHLQTEFPDGVEGKYEVMLVATSEFGCVDTAVRFVIVLPEVLLYVPNTFTPDNDEFNQDWGIHIEGVDVYNFELLIFNRWGEIIWESHDPEATWDGTYGGDYVQNGTYTWVIRAKDRINDDMYTWNGFVNVLK
jgi:gliding motility-associated-like protein